MNIMYQNDAISDFLKTRTACFETVDKIKSEDMSKSLAKYIDDIVKFRFDSF